MRTRIQLTEAAQEEHLEALRFYRQDSLHVARAFNREFKRQISLPRERPYLGPPYLDGTRLKVFSRFPYAFIYVVEEDLITIHAVKHHSRDPEYWLHRVAERRGR